MSLLLLNLPQLSAWFLRSTISRPSVIVISKPTNWALPIRAISCASRTRHIFRISRCLSIARQRLEALVALLSTASTRSRRRGVWLRGVLTMGLYYPSDFEKLGAFEFLDDVLQLWPLDQLCQLVEALSAAFDLLSCILRHIQIG